MFPEASGPWPYSVNLISLRMRHHAMASGYDRLADYIDGNLIHTSKHVAFFERLISKVFRGAIKNSGLTWYHRHAFLTELAVAKQWFKKSGQIFHYLYGENLFRYAGILRHLRKDNVIVCTYHTPEARFLEVVTSREFLRNVDAIIVVSEIQKQLFADYVPSERIFYVPHGIDVDVFSPSSPAHPINEGTLRCIAVGSHMRDYATLAGAARLLSKEGADITFDIVTRRTLSHHFVGINNVRLHFGISDESLIALYRNADVLALPILDATANNSLLEAMACGLAIVSTDLPAVHQYVNDECAILVSKGDATGLAEVLFKLSRNRDTVATMSTSSRTKSLEFDWKHVARRTMDVYDAAWALRQ
jgi:glycosyltransferase involved in cell wall biosynthesis